MLVKALLVALAIVAAVEGSVHVASKAAADCSVGLTPTVTFVTSCQTISSLDAACWTPHAPGADDTVLFPGGTNGSIPFEEKFTPLSVKSIVVAGGAKIAMHGGAIVVTECLQVSGTLEMVTDVKKIDNGTWTETAYPADASVPMGTDCRAVPRGFSPRICGPGAVYVSGSVSLSGLFASLWASTTVTSSATLTLNDESFLWGALTNFGTVSANHRFFFHGSLVNQAGGNVFFSEIRPDFWTLTPGHENATLSIVNYGSMSFTLPKDYQTNYNYVSTKDVNGTAFVTLVVVNHNTLLFNSWLRGTSVTTWAQIAFDVNNYGTTTWRGLQGFVGLGVMTNYGAIVADQSYVSFSNYISVNGTEAVINGGHFGFGLSEAVSEMLKERGVRGPYLSFVQLKWNRMISHDGTGLFVVHVPMEVQGAELAAGAFLQNSVPKGSSLLAPSVSGVMYVSGVLMSSREDDLLPGRAEIVVRPTGAILVPAESHMTMHAATKLTIEDGGLLRINGAVTTTNATTSVYDQRGRGHHHLGLLQFHHRSCGVGLQNVKGDFGLAGELMSLDAE